MQTAIAGLMMGAGTTEPHAGHLSESWPIVYTQEFEEKVRRGSASGITRGPGFDAYIDKKATEDCLDGAHSERRE